MGIVIISNDKKATIIQPSAFDYENIMQQILKEYPEIIPMNEISDELRLTVLAREFNISGDFIDILCVDSEGKITIVETKLDKNADKRNVISQILEYGALLTYDLSYEEFINQLETVISKKNLKTLPELIAENFKLNEAETIEFMQSMKVCFDKGEFRFVIVMDSLNDKLKHLITYIRENSKLDLLGMEMDIYRHEGTMILMPRLFGSEVRKGKSINREFKAWNNTTYFEDAEKKLNADQFLEFKWLFDELEKIKDEVEWSGTELRGKVGFVFYDISPKNTLALLSNGSIKDLSTDRTRNSGLPQERKNLFLENLKSLFPESYNEKSFGLYPSDYQGKSKEFIKLLKDLLRK